LKSTYTYILKWKYSRIYFKVAYTYTHISKWKYIHIYFQLAYTYTYILKWKYIHIYFRWHICTHIYLSGFEVTTALPLTLNIHTHTFLSKNTYTYISKWRIHTHKFLSEYEVSTVLPLLYVPAWYCVRVCVCVCMCVFVCVCVCVCVKFQFLVPGESKSLQIIFSKTTYIVCTTNVSPSTLI